MNYIGMLRQPRTEYGDMPVCPFVGAEVDKNKLMIEKFDPEETTLLNIIQKYEDSDYDSALLVQVADDVLLSRDTVGYQNFINKSLRENGYTHLACICFNPNDKLEIDGFNARSHAPYFLINIANKDVLAKAHKSLLKTKYFDKMNDYYLKYLHAYKDVKK